MRSALLPHVENGGGLVALVASRKDVRVDALGDLPADRQSIFRISSMTKPITAVATLLLIEQCVLRLDDPVTDLLPELADRHVLTSLGAELTDTVPQARAITVRDLLTFRMGFGIPLTAPDSTPIQRAATQLALGQGPPNPDAMPDPDEWLRRLATLPLMHQPGAAWMYSTGSDVLGVLIARASGQSFPTFLQEQIFIPLGMRNTGFSVPPVALARFTDCWSGSNLYDPAVGAWSRPPAFPSGAAGLVSTVDDYLLFARMLLAGGGRLLSRPLVELMTTDRIAGTPAPHWLPNYFDNNGFGFGVSIVTRRDDVLPVGTYGWDGGLGSVWRNDPAEQLITILLTTSTWTSPLPPPVVRDFWTSAYAGLD